MSCSPPIASHTVKGDHKVWSDPPHLTLTSASLPGGVPVARSTVFSCVVLGEWMAQGKRQVVGFLLESCSKSL